METHEIYRAALDTFGTESQITMLFEEIGELMVAICRLSRGRDKVAHVAEENADVRIMLDQMAILFDCEDEVERQRRYKLRRLEQRIDKAKLESNLRVVESNPPLTADELRQMMGEPVWVLPLDADGYWAIVTESLFSLRAGYLAYRRKPEEQP